MGGGNAQAAPATFIRTLIHKRTLVTITRRLSDSPRASVDQCSSEGDRGPIQRVADAGCPAGLVGLNK